MLAGRYPSDEFAEFRPRVVWDRVEGTLTARPGSRMLAIISGGTIPDRGLFGVFTPDGNRVGELDEEMVYESREGKIFLLLTTSWRIERRSLVWSRVVVTHARSHDGPAKRSNRSGAAAIGRPYELGRAVGEFLRTIDDTTNDMLRDDYALDPLAIANLRGYIAEERESTGGALPTDRQIVIERYRDELGDWRICVLSPFGARVHAPWCLAIEAVMRDRLGIEVQAIWGDDGVVLRLPEADEAPSIESLLLDPEDIENLVVEAVGSSALFAGRFRGKPGAHALLLPPLAKQAHPVVARCARRGAPTCWQCRRG